MDNLARRLLIEQTRKEVFDEIKKHHVGYAMDGNIVVKKTFIWQGRIFVIPDSEYQELFKETE